MDPDPSVGHRDQALGAVAQVIALMHMADRARSVRRRLHQLSGSCERIAEVNLTYGTERPVGSPIELSSRS